jgi:hypothetical protein
VKNLAALRAEALAEVGRKNMLYGALWPVGGMIVTAATSVLAAPAATYLLACAAIVFGAIRLGNGFSQARTKGCGLGSCSVVAALVSAALLLLASLVLQRPWRTYTNKPLGFSVRYPVLWKAEVQRIAQLHTISFAPRYGWVPERRRLEIQVIGGADESQLTSSDYMSVLEDAALADPRATIRTLRSRYVDSRPGAEMAFEMEAPDLEEGTALWVAICGTRSYRFMLGAIEVGGNAEGLESFHARFVDSFRFLERE